MTTPPARKRKLIEVALPLDEINAACKADKDRKTGTIRNLHKWFAPMPLPAWRALLFAVLVDDPGDDTQRAYLLDLIKRLVGQGADLPAQSDLDEAHALLIKQFPEGLPTVLDPFCGGGSTLVEAQRLGLATIGTDLNPVPVLITRTLTELLPTVHGQTAIAARGVAPSASTDGLFAAELMTGDYAGLASDVLHYAGQLQDRAFSKLSDHYPSRPGETVVAWLWARTAHCPNPVCGIESVLTTTWWLSKRPGALAWIEPEVQEGKVNLRVLTGQHVGTAPPAPKAARGASFTCINCSNPISETDLEEIAERTGLGLRIVAVASDVKGKRIFRAPEPSEEAAASFDVSEFNPPATVRASDGGTRRRFGLDTQADLYVPRQIAVLATLSDLVADLPDQIRQAGASDAWVKAVATILGLAVGRLAHGGSSQTRWKFDSRTGSAKPEAAFGRNDLPFTWDFVEVNPFSGGSWSWKQCIDTMLDALAYVPHGHGTTARVDARTSRLPVRGLVATDPPYFDAIGYADLSDYFYVWHRRALKGIHPDLYGTLATPKDDELTALPARHGNSREAARDYFITGFTQTFRNLVESLDDDIPLLVVYASREQRGGQDEATRWSSILTAMIQADLEITGTWPIHGTGSTRMIGQGANAVASYIAMVCRPRPQHAVTCSLADFNRALRRELGSAVRDLQAASILPVDMGQAVLGPGMQIYSRYRAVLDQSGTRVPVDQAIRLINAALGEVSDEQEGELDPESRFATRWWERYGWEAGTFGDADKTARPLGIGVDDVVRAQVATSQANKVQLVGRGNLDAAWAPSKDAHPTAWEAVHHLAHRLIDRGGELEAARLMAQLGTLHDPAMALTYRLHDIAGAQGRTGDQERYNALINSWSELVKLSAGIAAPAEGLF